MGFTTPCFIRKNTEELRKKLEELGYKMLSPIEYDNLECSNGWVNDIKSPNDCNGIDCGTGEELFLGIAALRDDIDIDQWFTDGKEWFQCQYLKAGMHYQDKPEILFEKWHKATVNELIEHFKEKE
jgi:hypothetical protein